jgi:hypothetical protein
MRSTNELASSDQIKPVQYALQPQQMKLKLRETIHLLIQKLKIIVSCLKVTKNVNTLIDGDEAIYFAA